MTPQEIKLTRQTAKMLVQNTIGSTGQDVYRSNFLKFSADDLRNMVAVVMSQNIKDNEVRKEMHDVLKKWNEAKTEDMLWVVMVTGSIARGLE